MSDQILTQEEIDALLTAMDNGEVDLAEEKPEAEVVAYNLTSQNIMLRDQFHALEEVYDKLAGLMGTSFSASLQRSIEVEFISTEMVKYTECIGAFSNPTNFSIFTMDPLIGSAMLAIEPRLVYSLIDCMFGGDGKPTERMREFTLIEQRMMRKFALEVLSNLEKAWKIVGPIKVLLKKSEIKPEFVHLASSNDIMVVIVFGVKGQEFSGNLHFCIPYLMLEPIKDKLSSKYIREKDTEHSWREQLEMLLQDIPVTLVAELGISARSVGNLLDLQVDDVIQLNTGPEDLVTLTVDNIPKFLGFPGIIKGNRAVEIAALHHKNGGEN
ncbi:MAG: flagellar motor switch protein FliM [Deltaproteobacteria bacterium]|jgi:flagellar motor switch protein FliM|nr:flagellar motor switch protein FliM [Deltaproteobacteria bacterium]